MDVGRRVGEALGRGVAATSRLSGGCIAEVHRVDLDDGGRVVAKVAEGGVGGEGGEGARASLDVEGFMLDYLARRTRLPVPRILHVEPSLLVMEFVPGRTGCRAEAEAHAADLLAELHGLSAPRFGLERDTLIGPLMQPNAWAESWVRFFAERRLVYMAGEAREAGRITPGLARRVESLAGRLDEHLAEPDAPSLVHGDVWSGNVLCDGERVSAFLDPAIYYGDAEVELAFITLFGTFGRGFFERYAERRPIRPGFFEMRRHVYNLYPLLVHARLFGGGYAAQVEATLGRLGC